MLYQILIKILIEKIDKWFIIERGIFEKKLKLLYSKKSIFSDLRINKVPLYADIKHKKSN